MYEDLAFSIASEEPGVDGLECPENHVPNETTKKLLKMLKMEKISKKQSV